MFDAVLILNQITKDLESPRKFNAQNTNCYLSLCFMCAVLR